MSDQLQNIMAQAIGQEQAQAAILALVDAMPGAVVRIPTGATQVREARNAEIRRLHRTAKFSVSALAVQYHLTEKQILRVVGS